MNETLIHFLVAFVPVALVFAFLLLHRQQTIRAELEDQRLRQEHCNRVSAADEHRRVALIQALTPVLTHAFVKILDDLGGSATDDIPYADFEPRPEPPAD